MASENPLHQFEIARIVPLKVGNVDVSFTNSSLFMLISVVLIIALMVFATRKTSLVPSRWQSMAELSYEFVAKLIVENAGQEGMKYFPFIFSLFMFILVGNFIGLVPHSFTFTSHIVVTFALAAVVFIGVTVIGIARHGFHFLSLFVPHGVPKPLLLLLVPIEVISYFIRPFTLSIRLFANMMAGHMILFIFASFVLPLGIAGFGIAGLIPLMVDVGLFLLEILVAALQAYVFAILTCLYLRDALYLH